MILCVDDIITIYRRLARGFLAIVALVDAADGTLDASYHGLVQRVTIALGFGWLSMIALLLLRERQTAGQFATSAQPPASRPANATQFYEPLSGWEAAGEAEALLAGVHVESLAA
jgi:hypothetical protein